MSFPVSFGLIFLVGRSISVGVDGARVHNVVAKPKSTATGVILSPTHLIAWHVVVWSQVILKALGTTPCGRTRVS